MAGEIIRPKDLATERTSPVASEFMVVDNGVTVAKSKIEDVVKAGRPAASQAEAEAGTNSTKAMTPLTTAQAIVSQGGARFASFAQGAKADTAVQPSSLALVATSGEYGDLAGKPVIPPGLADGDKGDISVSSSGTVWEINKRFNTVASLLADTTMGYAGSGSAVTVAPGDPVEAQGFRYAAVASDTTDADIETAGGLKLKGLNFEEVTARTRLDAEALVIAPAPKAIRVLGYYAPGDAGRPFSYKLVSSEPGHAGKFSLVLASGDTVWYELSELSVNRRMFGARCDWDWATSTGTDDTASIQAMIDYCNPFQWAGSVVATKSAQFKPLAVIEDYLPGASKSTSPLRLSPFVRWRGLRTGGFFSRGNEIVADFDSVTNFALDSAPYTTDGTRPLGLSTSGAQFNANTYSGCPGWELDGVSVVVPAGRNLRGVLNRSSAQESKVRNCHFMGGNIGVQTSATWGGHIRDNHIVCNAVGLLNNSDVTVDDQENNYITVKAANKPTPDTQFVYPIFPNAIGLNKAIGIYNRYAAPRLKGNTIEGPEVGIMAMSGYGIRAVDNYMEVVSEYCYMTHTCSLHVDVGYTFCATASLVWADGAAINMCKLDISAHRGGSAGGVFLIANMGQGSAYMTTEIWGTSRFPLVGTSTRIAYPDRVFYGSTTHNFPSIPAGSAATVDVNVANMPANAFCSYVRFGGTIAPGLFITAFPTGAGTARIHAFNMSAAAIDLANGDFVVCMRDQPGLPASLV